MSLGKNLQFLRKMYHSMTQEELAEKMGVSRQTISKWEMDGAFPEMEKAIALSKLFNCTLDELLKEDMGIGDSAYKNLRVEEMQSFYYVRYPVISKMPEEDATNHMLSWAKMMEIENPNLIGWDFPVVSQEQSNVFHMHGYCSACILPKDYEKKCKESILQPYTKYAVITIENPFHNPFSRIPNAYKTLNRFMEVNGLIPDYKRDHISCYEKEYTVGDTTYMDVYIAIQS